MSEPQVLHAEATAEENRAENKYDTRGLEASHLAAGQANKVAELESALETFEGLKEQPASTPLKSVPDRTATGWVCGMGIVGPTAGGTEIEIDGTEVPVITPESPLGNQIMGLGAGAEVPGRIRRPNQRLWSKRSVIALFFATFLGSLEGPALIPSA